MVREVNSMGMEVCCTLGMLTEGQVWSLCLFVVIFINLAQYHFFLFVNICCFGLLGFMKVFLTIFGQYRCASVASLPMPSVLGLYTPPVQNQSGADSRLHWTACRQCDANWD
jgi:hypothetical protein